MHPWNLVLWNWAKYIRAGGNQADYEKYYKKALDITCENKSNVTMMAFALSMAADNLLWCLKNNSKAAHEAACEFGGIIKLLKEANMPETMRKHFGLDTVRDGGGYSPALLEQIAGAYLK